jgi:hypothetical protein
MACRLVSGLLFHDYRWPSGIRLIPGILEFNRQPIQHEVGNGFAELGPQVHPLFIHSTLLVDNVEHHLLVLARSVPAAAASIFKLQLSEDHPCA